jgi:spectinomycin phosphotransferase
MLTPPDLNTETIADHVRDTWSVDTARVTFLPIGADVNSAVFRLDTTDGVAYFLKLRRGPFHEIAVSVPAFLHDHGAAAVMAPLPSADGALWVEGHGFAWMLYPFFAGSNGFERPMSDAQWIALGKSVRAVQTAVLPESLVARIPREDYSPQWRDITLAFDRQAEADAFTDPQAARLAAFWRIKGREIRAMVERAAHLAQILRRRALPFVLCHTDLHAGNVLLGAENELVIVDWDDPIFAPKERDLMFIGGGIGGNWNTPREESLFYEGYGATEIDSAALAYYRYERIVADLAAYGEQIFGVRGSVEDREDGVRKVIGGFAPGQVVEIAHRTYQRLA